MTPQPTPMLPRRGVWLAFAAATLLVHRGVAQTVPAPREPAASDRDETVLLSPFTVDVSTDQGYYSPNSVSGTRTRTELINLPVNMSVFTSQFIKDIAARDLNDIVTYSAGVSQGTGGGSATNDGDTLGFTLRGQAGFVPYRNGFRRLRIVDPATIERVEVVKGPASVLYGLLNPGGMINYITKRPTQQRIADFTVNVGSYDFYRTVGDFNTVIVPQKLSLRLVGSYEDSRSIVDRYHNFTTVIDPSLRWWIRPETTLTLEYEKTSRHINGFKSGLPFNATLDFLAQGYPIDRHWNTHAASDYSDTDMTVRTAELVHRFNRNFLVRGNWTSEIWYDNVRQNGGNINLTSATSNLLNPRVLAWGRRGSWDEYKQAEVVNNFAFAGVESQTMVGFQDSSEEFRQVLATIAPPTQGVQWNVRNPATWVLSAQTEADILGVGAATGTKAENAVTTYYVTNQLSFLGGRVRTLAGYRSDKITANSFTPSAAVGSQYSSSTFKAIETPQVGILAKPMNGLSVYAQYSEAAVNLYTALQRHADGSFFLPVPGRGKGYDIGVKSELLEGRVAGGISTFVVENTNIVRTLPQVQLPDGSLITPADQSGTDRSTGVEVDLRLRPAKGTQVVLAYANTDAYVKSDLQASTTINGVRVLTRSGHRLQNAPKHNASLWVRQELGSLGRLTGLYVAGGGHYDSARAFTEAYNVVNGVLTPPPSLGAYATFDLSAGGLLVVGKTRYRAALSLKNVADKIYLVERYHFGAPRTVELSITASF